MDIKALAEKYESYIIERRRYYHEHPELSDAEVKTSAQLKADFLEMGIEMKQMKDHYGLYGYIHGKKPGKIVALRSDIDGLKIVEETGLPYAATNGNMHACGHDNHMAMILGAAKILTEMKEEIQGSVKFLLQPAEELGKGAQWMVDEGLLDDVDAVYGAHIWGDFDAPLVDVTAGNRMACSDLFKIYVNGVGAHGAAPHLGIDAITVAAAIITNLQQHVSRINNPLNPLVITIGIIRGGQRFNTIANEVYMEGGLRTFQTGNEEEKIMRHIIETTAQTFGTTATLEYERLTVPVINNDEQLNRIAYHAVKKLYGEEGIGHLPTMMSSEDFSALGKKVPCFFAFIGSRNKEKGLIYTNHHEKYDIDESVLMRGSAVMAQFAFDFLQETCDN